MRTLPDGFTLKVGSHGFDWNGPNDPGDCCLLESCAWVCEMPNKTDSPTCVESGVCTNFGRWLNDRYAPTHGEQLLTFIEPLIAVDGSIEKELRRAWMCADWAIRTCLPIALRATEGGALARQLESADEVSDAASYALVQPLLELAEYVGYAAKYAAKYAAEYAAKYAEYAAGYAKYAESAAKSAAKDAAKYAECAAAYAYYAECAEDAKYAAATGIALMQRMLTL